MLRIIRTIFESLLIRLLPAQGCHRAAGPRPVERQAGAPTARPAFVSVPAPQGEDVPLVRPYVLTPSERRPEHRVRRRQLWSAACGAVGADLLSGMAVTAR
ncbi:hypothetical protein GCM10017688_47190 [Streptomyces ramulosus]